MVLPKSDFKGGAHQTWLAAKSPEKWAVKLEKKRICPWEKIHCHVWWPESTIICSTFFGECLRSRDHFRQVPQPLFCSILGKYFFFTCLWWWCGHGWKTLKNIVHPCWLMGGWISSCNGDWRLEGPIQKCRPAYAQWVDTKPCLGWITPSTHGTTIHDHSQGTIFAGKNHSTDWFWRTTTISIFGGFLK